MNKAHLQCADCVLQRICKFYTDDVRETECEHQQHYREYFTKYFVIFLQILRFQLESKKI